MSISVLIPSYNHELFIERTLRSVFKQTLLPTELFVIDDGSNDNSVKIIEEVLQDCPFESKLITHPNQGLCATLNEGISLSKGEFFSYISSDDVWLPGFLESRVNLLKQRREALLAFGHSYLINENDEIFDHTENWGGYTDGRVLEMLLMPRIPASASVLYRRSTLEKTAWNESSILEDYDLYLRLSALGEFALDKNTLSAWRIHDKNTSNDFELMMNEWLIAIERNSSEIGLDESEICRIKSQIRFKTVPDFIRRGKKKEALRLARENYKAASSPLEIAKLLARFIVPHKLLLLLRAAKRREAIAKYGVLEI